MSGRRTFQKFLKSLENCVIFEFFTFFFFYKMRRSAVFQPMCWKCMLGDNSILPVLESVPFKKQMRVFNVVSEKKKSLNASQFLSVALRVTAFHSPLFCANAVFKKFTLVVEISIISLSTDFFFLLLLLFFAQALPGGC